MADSPQNAGISMIYIDSSMMVDFDNCKEKFRLTWLMNRASASASIHQVFGSAVHDAVEAFWRGSDFPAALKLATDKMQTEEHRVRSSDQKKWSDLKGILPTCVATYFDSVEQDESKLLKIDDRPAVEYEWRLPNPFGIEGVTLCGRIDRVQQGPFLFDCKTATEMDGEDESGKHVGWEKSYRAAMVKDRGIGTYDFFLRQIGFTPSMVALEVILKPSERYGKKCRIVRLELPEVLAYRERFDMLLEHTCREILHYVSAYNSMSPWPMNVSACSGKYGMCQYAALCQSGSNPRTEKLYREREEHLSITDKRIEL